MTVFELVENELNQAGCPGCQKHKMELSLRCTFGGKMCLFAAQCRDCGYLFELNETTLHLAETQMESDRKIKQSGCPACRKKEVEITFRCDLADQDCFFLATCHSCHHIFKV
jgi:hypothetical protein